MLPIPNADEESYDVAPLLDRDADECEPSAVDGQPSSAADSSQLDEAPISSASVADGEGGDSEWQERLGARARRVQFAELKGGLQLHSSLDDEHDDPMWESDGEDEGGAGQSKAERRQRRRRRSQVSFVAAAVVVAGAAAGAWTVLLPQPLECTPRLLTATRFKVDVSDFWVPKISGTLQLVFAVRNPNLFRTMQLESCRITVLEQATGLKLGSGNQGPFLLPKMHTTQLTMPLRDIGGGLPREEQRRLAELFLRHKALLLTILATCTSKLPKEKTSKTISTNTSRRLDLASSAKDPFYVKPPPPPCAEGGEESVHDVNF